MQFGPLQLAFPSGWEFTFPEAGPVEGTGPHGESALVSHSSANQTASATELEAHFEGLREQSLQMLKAVAVEHGAVLREPVVLRASPPPFVAAAASELQRHGQQAYFLQYVLLSLRSQHYFNMAGLGSAGEALARWDPVFLGARLNAQ
jgi:hypothetical protein